MVKTVHIFVQEFVRVQCAMHPIDTDLNEGDVKKREEEVHVPAPDLINIEVGKGEIVLDEILAQNRQPSVDKEGGICEFHLVCDGVP